jgi:hypothetical protein
LSERISSRPGQAGHRDLQRHGDEALDLLGRAARRLGGDLHLHVGHVGEGIDRQLARRVQAEGQQHERATTTTTSRCWSGPDKGFNH